MDKDLLAILEDRLNSLAETISTLRKENGALADTLRERDETIARLEEDFAQLSGQLDDLQDEKSKTIARIEGLLSRFQDSGNG